MLHRGPSTGEYTVPGIEYLPRPLMVRAFAIPAHSTVAVHTHPWAQLMYATAGMLEVHTPQGRSLVSPQCAVWIPPHLPHGVTTREDVAFHSLYLDVAAVGDVASDCTVLRMTSLLRELVIATGSLPKHYDASGPDGALVQLIVDRVRHLAPASFTLPMPSDPRLLKIAQALQENPGDVRHLDAWGQRVGATRRTLSRLFRQETGLSFTTWRQAARLIAAWPMLEEGASVTSVAKALGYDSTSSFIAQFRKYHGITPGELAREFPIRRRGRHRTTKTSGPAGRLDNTARNAVAFF